LGGYQLGGSAVDGPFDAPIKQPRQRPSESAERSTILTPATKQSPREGQSLAINRDDLSAFVAAILCFATPMSGGFEPAASGKNR